MSHGQLHFHPELDRPSLTPSVCESPGPLPYHRAIVAHLRSNEPGLWRWFASSDKRSKDAEAVRLDLLKSTYRIEPALQPKLHEMAHAVRAAMRLNCAVTLYQSQSDGTRNAALAYLPGEAHVILSGPLTTMLTENELRAVLAHELAHYRLYEEDDGAHRIAGDLLRALSADAVIGPVASESARLYSLWTEIYADRWANHVSGDVKGTITALIKIETGVDDVSAESYLRQADEIFRKDKARADHVSHPETYIRARALHLWADQGEEAHAEIEHMIEGGLDLNRLDLLGQTRAAELTRRFLQILLSPEWRRTEASLAHARLFFPDFTPARNDDDEATIKVELERGDTSLRDYLCYLMLDFATVDRDMSDIALSAALVLARRLGIDKQFTEIALKELTLGKKAFAKLDKEAEALLARTEATHPK